MKYRGLTTRLKNLEDLARHLPGPPDLARIAKMQEQGLDVLLWPDGSLVGVWPILKDEEISDRPGGADPGT
jgi:hypothetical protein